MSHNFGDNYTNNKPGVVIVDTDTLNITHYDNPFAPLFLKIKVNSVSELRKSLDNYINNKLCIRVTSDISIVEDIRSYISTLNNVVASRVVGTVSTSDYQNTIKLDEVQIDHVNDYQYLRNL